MYGLDGEETWYADFVRGKGVEPQPSFVDHVSYVEGTYEGAVGALAACKQNLKNHIKPFKDFPVERGKTNMFHVSVCKYSEDILH